MSRIGYIENRLCLYARRLLLSIQKLSWLVRRIDKRECSRAETRSTQRRKGWMHPGGHLESLGMPNPGIFQPTIRQWQKAKDVSFGKSQRSSKSERFSVQFGNWRRVPRVLLQRVRKR